MSSTPAGYELQFNDSIPYHLKPKPLYGNIVDVSLTTYKCTIVTWPPPQRSRKNHKIKMYTFMLNELPHTQASGVLKNALVAWVTKARAAEFEHESIDRQNVNRNGHSPSPKHKQSHSRNLSKSSTTSPTRNDGSRSASRLSFKEKQGLQLGPRVTFLDEEEVIAPPPLPPKDAKYQMLQSPSHLSPASSPSKRRHHHHHHQRRRSSDVGHEGHAVDIGLVWWEAELHGQRV